MAEKTNTPAVVPDPAKHNADVAQKLISQSTALVTGDIDTEAATSALDKLAAVETAKRQNTAPAPDPAKVAADKAAAEQAAKDKLAAAGTAPDPEAVAKAEKEAAAKEAADKAASDLSNKIFKDAPTLPAGAAPKSSEAFAAIKETAVKEISARETELEKLRKEKADLEKKLKDPVPPEVLKELEDHRAWRAKLDVDADPKFKEFDKSIATTQEFIYDQLSKNPSVTKETIEQIKKLGGPENVNLTKLFESIKDPVLQRIVESKVADIQMAKYNKEQAIKSTKDNIQKYVGDRAAAYKNASTQHTTATKARVDGLISQLPWTKEKAIDEKATPEVKKEAEEYNKWLHGVNDQLGAALQDDSAEMRAILLVGTAQLFHLQRENAAVVLERDTIKKELATLTEKFNKVKESSTSRLRESGAPTTGTPKIAKADDINTRPGDALDNIAKQVMEQRAAAATGA